MAFNNDRNSRGGGGGFRSPRPSYGDRPRFNDRGPKEMHQAICATCGKECSVPFRPTSGKPVYCSDCFEKNGGGSERRSFERPERRFDKPESSPRFAGEAGRTPEASYTRQFDELNAKLDNILKILTPLVPPEDEEEAEEATTASVDSASVATSAKEADSGESKEKPAKKAKKSTKK